MVITIRWWKEKEGGCGVCGLRGLLLWSDLGPSNEREKYLLIQAHLEISFYVRPIVNVSAFTNVAITNFFFFCGFFGSNQIT